MQFLIGHNCASSVIILWTSRTRLQMAVLFFTDTVFLTEFRHENKMQKKKRSSGADIGTKARANYLWHLFKWWTTDGAEQIEEKLRGAIRKLLVESVWCPELNTSERWWTFRRHERLQLFFFFLFFNLRMQISFQTNRKLHPLHPHVTFWMYYNGFIHDFKLPRPIVQSINIFRDKTSGENWDGNFGSDNISSCGFATFKHFHRSVPAAN